MKKLENFIRRLIGQIHFQYLRVMVRAVTEFHAQLAVSRFAGDLANVFRCFADDRGDDLFNGLNLRGCWFAGKGQEAKLEL